MTDPRRRLRADPRLPAYLVAGFGGLILAVALARPELAALGAPFLVLGALGLSHGAPPPPSGHVTLATDRALEGELVEGEVVVDWEGEAEVDVMLAGWRGVAPSDNEPVLGWSLPVGRGPVSLPLRVRAQSWGVHGLGSLWVRIRRPGSFRVDEYTLGAAPELRVLPHALRLSRLLKPGNPRAIAGSHTSRLRGHGTDFAELRPYGPGDRLRDVSWGASARLGVPWVRVNHSERTGTVVLVLDAVFSDESTSAEALARAARAAWAVTSAHLRAQDRVGLLAQGRTVAWVPPRGGRRARWMLLDELLAVGRAAEDPSRRTRRRGRVQIPSDALVVGVTALRSETFAADLLHHRRAGQTAVALVVDTSDLLPAVRGPVDEAARRIWIARREAERHVLERGGVPTALVTAAGGVGPAILSLRRRMGGMRAPSRLGAAGR